MPSNAAGDHVQTFSSAVADAPLLPASAGVHKWMTDPPYQMVPPRSFTFQRNKGLNRE